MKTISMLIGLLLFFLVGCAARQVEETTVEAESVVVSEIAPPSSEETPTKVEPVVTLTTPETTPEMTPQREEPPVIGSVRHIAIAIAKQQPWYRHGRNENELASRKAFAFEIAGIIRDYSEEWRFDPYVVLSIAKKESSLHPRWILGPGVGGRGEMGMFQVMPRGRAVRTCSDGCDDLFNPRCNARTALCWLDLARRQCGDDPWLYVAGYGATRCPRTYDEARSWRPPNRAREILCDILGEEECSSRWPS